MSVRDELIALTNDDGLIIPETVHAWAEGHPKSQLYGRLQWNDTKAGYQYRLWQIRHIIAVEIRFAENGQRQTLSLSIDRIKSGGGYRDVIAVRDNQVLATIALDDALRDLDRVRAKYEYLKDLMGVWKAIDRVKAKSGRGKSKKREQKEERPSL